MSLLNYMLVPANGPGISPYSKIESSFAITTHPSDVIEQAKQRFARDTRADKVGLHIGVFVNEDGSITSEVVNTASQRVFERIKAFPYGPAPGNPQVLEAAIEFVFGPMLRDQLGGYDPQTFLRAYQTVGGTHANYLAAVFLRNCHESSEISIANPTWPNHKSIYEKAGLQTNSYFYYSDQTNALDFDRTYTDLKRLKPHSIIGVQTRCQNPTGLDWNETQWEAVASLAAKNGHVLVFDTAYDGYGSGRPFDNRPIGISVKAGVEVLVPYSCAKTFSAYGERVGFLFILSPQAEKAHARLTEEVRPLISCPPSLGAQIVCEVMKDEFLVAALANEHTARRQRVAQTRDGFVSLMQNEHDLQCFNHVREGSGMFCLLGFTAQQVHSIVERSGIHLVDDGRVNIAAITESNIERICAEFAREIKSS